VDFDDVWTVAVEEIRAQVEKNSDKTTLEINIDALVERIRKEHPNLFYDLTSAPKIVFN